MNPTFLYPPSHNHIRTVSNPVEEILYRSLLLIMEKSNSLAEIKSLLLFSILY